MTRRRAFSNQAQALLAALLGARDRWSYGYELASTTGTSRESLSLLIRSKRKAGFRGVSAAVANGAASSRLPLTAAVTVARAGGEARGVDRAVAAAELALQRRVVERPALRLASHMLRRLRGGLSPRLRMVAPMKQLSGYRTTGALVSLGLPARHLALAFAARPRALAPATATHPAWRHPN